jgi:O-antigen ligase
MTWIDSFRTFSEHPFFGKGIGQNACNINYFDPSGTMQTLTDAHNILLNVAAESGIFGLLGILAIAFYFTKVKVFSIFEDNETNIIRVGLVLAFISAFVYQGIGGSFEDARHLWVLVGLIIASDDFLQTSKI